MYIQKAALCKKGTKKTKDYKKEKNEKPQPLSSSPGIKNPKRKVKKWISTWKRALGNCGLATNSWRASSLFCVAIAYH